MPTPPPTGPLVTRGTVATQLRELGVQDGETLLVHSSLKSLGWVCGGPVAVVQGLLDALGPKGTLVVPTQTGGLSDPADWENPPVPVEWWDEIRTSMPPYDPLITPPAVSACSRRPCAPGPAPCAARTRRRRSPRSAPARVR